MYGRQVFTMKRFLVFIILIMVAAGVTAWYYYRPETPVAGNVREAYINYVIDGDSLDITFDGKEEQLRLIGIDCPERYNEDGTDNPEGKLVQDHLKTIFRQGDKVYIELGEQERDQYGRLLGYLYRDPGATEMLNLELLEMGYAEVLTFEPNDKYEDVFIRAMNRAKQEGVGLWKE